MLFLRPLSFFIFFSIGINVYVYSQKHKSVLQRKYPPLALQKDAEIFRNVAMKMHPSIGVYRPKEFYDKLFSSYMGSLSDSLTEREFRLRSCLVSTELLCGHTDVIYSKEYYKAMSKKKLNFSPYIFIPLQNKVYVIANLNKKADSSLKNGLEIYKINGIGTDSILRHCKRFINVDGFNSTAKDHYIQLAFNAYYPALFGRPDSFVVEYKEGNHTNSCRYPAFQPKTLPIIPLGPRDDSLYIHIPRAAIKYRFLDPDNKTLLLRLTRFSRKGSKKAYRRIFRKLKNNTTENLVLDIRNNGGGSLENAYRLLSYLIDTSATQTLKTRIKKYPYSKYTHGNIFFKLTRFAFVIIGKKIVKNDTDYFVYKVKPRNKNHFDKNLYVLINGGSFSAAALVAAYLKYHNRAVFIGEETAGAIEGCNAGITPLYKLPNTKIRIRIPAFRIVHDVSPDITGHGILPDYKIEYTIKDILAKRDLELLKVKELIHIGNTTRKR
jgi:hypothetical protein